MKHRIVDTLQKYLLNPPIKLLFAMGLAPARICAPGNHRSHDREGALHSSWRRAHR
jgi:hypothetical protein